MGAMILLEEIGAGLLGWIGLGLIYGVLVLANGRSDDALPHDAFDIPPLAVLTLMVSLWPFFVAVDFASTLRRALHWR